MKLKHSTMAEVIEDIAEELAVNGLPADECEERSRNIITACLGQIPHWRDVAAMLAPSEINTGIDNGLYRIRAASQAIAIYIQHVSDNTHRLWTSLMQDVGFSPEQADEWIASRIRNEKLRVSR